MEQTSVNISSKTRKLTATALLATIATVLMYFETPIPLMPPFLKMDISNVIVLTGSFLFGPICAVAIAFVKALFHALQTQSGFVGELADFLTACALAVPAGMIYIKKRTKKSAILACAVGVITMAAVGVLANYAILIPFYSEIMPMEAIWAACAKINPIIVDLNSYLMYGALPFNLLKGIVLSVVTILIYKPISRLSRNYIQK